MKFKVGDIVVNNDLENGYSITTKSNGFEGEVIDINGSQIRVRVLKSKDSTDIGRSYWVQAKHFKTLSEGIEFEFESKTERTIDYGDIVLTDDENKLLIVADSDGEDYRFIDLNRLMVSGIFKTVEGLIDTIERDYGSIISTVKKSDYLIKVK
ncbi:hypothetical protein ACV3Z5_13970 [Clostridium perfringens]